MNKGSLLAIGDVVLAFSLCGVVTAKEARMP